jgi:hypothetical protein
LASAQDNGEQAKACNEAKCWLHKVILSEKYGTAIYTLSHEKSHSSKDAQLLMPTIATRIFVGFLV